MKNTLSFPQYVDAANDYLEYISSPEELGMLTAHLPHEWVALNMTKTYMVFHPMGISFRMAALIIYSALTEGNRQLMQSLPKEMVN